MVDMSIGERLRELRLAKGLTLEQAGAVAETTKQSMSQIEKGVTKEPGALPLLRWARHYGVSAEWLITGKGNRFDVPSQDARPDFDKIASAVNVLTHYLELVNDPPEWVHDPILLETAYMVVEEFGEPSAPNNVLDLTKLLSKRLRGSKDEQQEVRGTGTAARR